MTNFFERFKGLVKNEKQQKTLHQLHTKLIKTFPHHHEDEIAKIACIAGLLARVAFVDLHMAESEISKMATILNKWGSLNHEEATLLAQMAHDEVKELGGLENHLYCHPLGNMLSKPERQDLLCALFAIAASDESVSGEETEEIRLIAKGLLLEPGDFIAAKVSVKEFLSVLK